jgi:D-sedoheptulose 7-phosphate isomerase
VVAERDHLTEPEQLELLPNALAGLQRLRALNLGMVLVTNQSVIGRGLLGSDGLARIHEHLADLLAEGGVRLDGIFFCPHLPEAGCECRKPRPGLVRRAAAELGFDPAASFVIGDKDCDMDLGRAVGATTLLVRTGYGARHLAEGLAKPQLVVEDMLEAAVLIEHLVDNGAGQGFPGLCAGAASRLRTHLFGSIATKQQLLKHGERDLLAAAAEIADCLRWGGKVLLCGNGGSAADAQHIAAELVSVLTTDYPRPGLAAMALTTDTSILTASANDFGFGGIFERQVQAVGRPGDVLVGISTSGNSENVLRAMRYARKSGLRTVALTGSSGGKMLPLADVVIRVPSMVVQHIQEAHITIGHILCDLVERAVCPRPE